MDASDLYLLAALYYLGPGNHAPQSTVDRLVAQALITHSGGRSALTTTGLAACTALMRTLRSGPEEALHQEIEAILAEPGSWMTKFDRAFAAYRASGLLLDYSDPDTSYEEGVCALARAVREAAGR